MNYSEIQLTAKEEAILRSLTQSTKMALDRKDVANLINLGFISPITIPPNHAWSGLFYLSDNGQRYVEYQTRRETNQRIHYCLQILAIVMPLITFCLGLLVEHSFSLLG